MQLVGNLQGTLHNLIKLWSNTVNIQWFYTFDTPAVWILFLYIGPAGVLGIDSMCRPGQIKR